MKKNNGAISVFTLLAMLFFLFFIMVAYNNVSSKAKMQVETVDVLKNTYKGDVKAEDVLRQLDGGELNSEENNKEREIILKTDEQKNIVNSVSDTNAMYLYSNGKIYEF